MSNKDNPKRHHFIPEFVIQNFCDESGKVWVFDKNDVARGIEHRTPRGVFWRRHIYSEYNKEGKLEPKLEKAYRPSEDYWAPLLREVLGIVRSGKVPVLEPTHRDALQGFIYHQYKRVPGALDVVNVSEIIDQTIDSYIQDHPEKSAEAEQLRYGEGQIRLTQNARVRVLAKWSPEVNAALNTKTLVLAQIPDDRQSLVLGSVPTGRFGPKGAPLANSRFELSMPIASDVVLGFSGTGGGVERMEISNGDLIRRYNEDAFARSDVVASKSKRLLGSLVRPYIKLSRKKSEA